MSTEVKKCENCKFWYRVKLGDTFGSCRRAHPTVFLIVGQDALGRPQPGTFSSFPSVEGDVWCGEGELKSEIVS